MNSSLLWVFLSSAVLGACCASEARDHCGELRAMWIPHAHALRAGTLPNQLGHDYSQFDRLESYLVSTIGRARLGEGESYTNYVVRFSNLVIDGASTARRGEREALARNLEARLALIREACPGAD